MLDGGKGMTVLSIDLNQDEDEIIIEEELPGYTRFVCLVNWTVVFKLWILVINTCRTLVERLDSFSDFQ